MGLFSKKQSSGQPTTQDEVVETTDAVFDQQYRDELRQIGRDHFKQLIDASAANLKNNIDTTVKQVSGDLKEYMTRQLDITISAVNTEITSQLNERITEFNRQATEAQDLAAQSLNRNAQAVYEKYHQLSAALQQTVTSQEVMMITVFQESKDRAAAAQVGQDKAIEALNQSVASSRQKTEQLQQAMQQNISDQATKLAQLYQESLTQVTEARRAQNTALQTLGASTQALQQRHQQLSDMLDKSVADQKAMLVETINDNMARIIEHYLVGALGEQSDLKTQLPAILERLEQNKQVMSEDMKL